MPGTGTHVAFIAGLEFGSVGVGGALHGFGVGRLRGAVAVDFGAVLGEVGGCGAGNVRCGVGVGDGVEGRELRDSGVGGFWWGRLIAAPLGGGGGGGGVDGFALGGWWLAPVYW